MGAMDAVHLDQAIKKPRLIQKERVALIGSGNWGSTASRIVGANVRRFPDEFDDEVRMWVFEEDWHGRKLSEVINETKENPKYLPGIRLCDNLVAEPDLAKAVSGATMLIFVTPHQFVTGLIPVVKANMGPNAKACSLIKGMNVTPEGFQLVSELVREELGVECSVLMGANIAGEIAREGLSESTLGYRKGYEAQAESWKRLFHTSYFHVTAVPDPQGVELCGTLKNVVATGAGFSDGLGLGNNAKASIACLGLMEMLRLGREFFPAIQMSTLFESAGVADVLTSIYGGRNWKCGEAFARAIREGRPKTFEQLEEEMLHGQKLQGVLTAHEVRALLQKLGAEERYPLFTTIDRISVGELKPEAILQCHGALAPAAAGAPPPQVPGAGHRHRVAVIGSGNWGSVAARIVAQNTRRLEEFEPKVRMWVWEQDWQGQELSSVINETHENPKYLPGIKLGENLVAEPSLAKAVAGATMVLFAVPYPFLAGVVADLKHVMPKEAKVCSLVKGLRAKGDSLELPSRMIREELGLDPCVLMGATIANELAFELFSEASVGYPAGREQDALLWQRLFRTSYFRVSAVPHPLGMEMCGTLTGIVALGGGFCDAMALGNNTKAAIVRVGLREVQQLAEEIFPGFERNSLFEHAGVADLIATCYGGRARRCAEAFVRSIKAGKPRSFRELEADVMQGQRLQALDSLTHVLGVLERRGTVGRYPLLSAIQRICTREAAPESLISYADVRDT